MLLSVSLFCLLTPVAGLAQEQPPVPGTPGDATAAKRGPQAAEFAVVLAQFKKLQAEVGTIKVQYRGGRRRAPRRVEEEVRPAHRPGDVLQDKLIAAAEKAYVEAPNADKDVAGLLRSMLISRTQD